MAELAELPQVETLVDLHCVTRWSKLGVAFRGVRLATLIEHARPTASAKFVSFVAWSDRDHSTSLVLAEALALETLVAFAADGEPLSIEHGGPVRVIVPRRYFYKSLKWLRNIELLATDRLGYWEAEAGYHNHADPWREERYLAPQLSKQEAWSLLTSRNFSDRDLTSLDASGHDLTGLTAERSILRNADFRACRLVGANFRSANLSNAHFEKSDLSGASFRSSDCEGANFCGANLRGADLTGASLFGASFIDESDATCAAQIDAAAQIDPAALEQLTPRQAEFVRAALG